MFDHTAIAGLEGATSGRALVDTAGDVVGAPAGQPPARVVVNGGPGGCQPAARL